jgi:hypothetical protein
MPVNVTNRIIILEQDESKLRDSVHSAITVVLDKYHQAFIPMVGVIPAAGTEIAVSESLSTFERRLHRGRVRICQVLDHYRVQSLGRDFLLALEDYMLLPNAKGTVPFINDPAVAKEVALVRGFQSTDLMRLPARMIFLSLVSMRVLLLPLFGAPTFVPENFGLPGNERLLDLLHPALRELVFTLKPRPGRQTSIDWSVTAETMATVTATAVASSYKDWMPEKATQPVPGHSLSVGVATTWQDIADVSEDEIKVVYHRASQQHCGHRSVKLYLNCLYLCRKTDTARDTFFKAVYAVPHYRIYTPEFKIWAKRTNYPSEGSKVSNDTHHADLASNLGMLCSGFINGKQDDDGFVTSLSKVPRRKLIMDFDNLPEDGPIPSQYEFRWQDSMEQWKAAFALFKESKNYERESHSINPFTSFFLYLGVYLPAWCLKNPNSGVNFPDKIIDFKGAIFVYRPGSIRLPNVENPPLTFRQFNEKIHDGNSQETVAKSIRVLRDFFEEIIPSAELLGLPHNLANPVLDSAIPSCGGRPWGCTKADIPVPVTFLMLLYCYRLLDCMYKINEDLLRGENLVLSNQLFKFVRGKQSTDPANTLRSLKDLAVVNLDMAGTFDGQRVQFDVVPKKLFTPRQFCIKERGFLYLLDTGPLEQIVCMFETGLRGQSIQWLDTNFDFLVRAKDIVEDGIYPLHVNTDKVKNCAWVAYVAGRVINVLRKRRDFRDTLAGEIFEEQIYYEGNPASKWGKFLPLFSTNPENGFPHHDGTYSDQFKHLFHALQRYIDELGLNFIASTINGAQKPGFEVAATPHSARRAVVMQHISYLPAEYIGKYITGQTPRTVGYYAAVRPDSFNKVENHQQTFLTIDGARRAIDTSRGPEVTEPHKPSSALAKAFADNIAQAMHDFGPMSTAILEQEKTGRDLVQAGRHQRLAFEATHICPYGSECPPERKKQGLVRRCNFCDFALRTVDHLPAIASELRNLSEASREVDMRLDKAGDRMSIAQRGVLESRRREISEDVFGLRVADYVLRESLAQLKEEYRKDPHYFCFTPDIIVQDLEAAPFPLRDEGLKYVLSRLKEAKTYVSLNDRTIKANIAKFSRLYLTKSGDLGDGFNDQDLDQAAADVYSLVHGILTANKMTVDDLVVELNKDVGEIAGSVTAGRTLLSPGITNLISGAGLGISL